MVALFGGQPFLSMSQVNEIQRILNHSLPNCYYDAVISRNDDMGWYSVEIPLDITIHEFLKAVKALQDNGMNTLLDNYMRWDIYGTCSSVAVRYK